jgi:hypothetical protein
MMASNMQQTQGYWDVAECRWIGAGTVASTHLVPAGLLRTVALNTDGIRLPTQRGPRRTAAA